MLYCVSLLEEPIEKRGETVYLITLTNHFYILCFFCGKERTLLDSELWLNYKFTSPAVSLFLYFHMGMKECMCVCVWECTDPFLLKRDRNTHMWWIRGGWSSELCRALTESSFEMYIQCEGLKWFLLNSIFYRFCRHFVVGRKNKWNFMGAFLSVFWSHSHIFIIHQITLDKAGVERNWLHLLKLL